MKPFEQVYAEAIAEARDEADAKCRADFASKYPRSADETEGQYQSRVEGWIKNKRMDIESGAKSIVIPKLEAATEKAKIEHTVNVSLIEVAHNKRVADQDRARQAATAQAAREQAARDAAQAILTDAARRDVPVAHSAGAARIYADAGFEYVDAIGLMPKLIPVE